MLFPMMNKQHFTRRVVALLLLLGLGLSGSFSKAGDNPPVVHKYTAVLIWGTDGPKPEDKDFKDVDAKLVERFQGFAKWKNYYEVKRKDVDIKAGEAKNVELSEKCFVKLHLTQKEELELELFGDKAPVYKGKQSMPLKEDLIMGGPAVDRNAWFVILKPRSVSK